ncbi:MAG: hypothetical protein JWN07_2899 [Hyphomicrobiales bacterium]|nr:hypothetical protein [Hyphomicrobiales bacterium]
MKAGRLAAFGHGIEDENVQRPRGFGIVNLY